MPASSATADGIRAAFADTFGDGSDVVIAMAPGRVNLIGEYTDFNDGFVLPMTVDRGVYVAIRKRSDRRVRIRSLRYAETVDYDITRFERPRPGSWQSYVLGIVEECRARGLIEHGLDAVVDGDIPAGAGLSSSAALEVAMAIALQQALGFDMGASDMARLCQHVEHHYADVLCGIMDQYACRLGRRGHALLLDCRSLEHEDVPLALGDYRVVIINSGVERSLAASAYNARRAECLEAVEHFSRRLPGIRSLRDVSAELFEEHGDGMSTAAHRRGRHVVSENARTLKAAAALRDGHVDTVGTLMIESHRSLREDFEVSCRELDLLVEVATESDGVLGSRMTGAGFGGCTVSLVHRDAVDDLADRLAAKYRARVNITPGVAVLDGNLEAGRLPR